MNKDFILYLMIGIIFVSVIVFVTYFEYKADAICQDLGFDYAIKITANLNFKCAQIVTYNDMSKGHITSRGYYPLFQLKGEKNE